MKWVKIGKLFNLFFELIYEYYVEKVLDRCIGFLKDKSLLKNLELFL